MMLSELKKRLPLPSLDRGPNLTKQLWDVLSALPGGKTVFSRAIGHLAPYSGTIRPRVRVLREGYAEVDITERKAIRNHVDCIHAIALANLAELTNALALFYSLPDDARFIPNGLEIEYLKKARGTITAFAEAPVPRSSMRAPVVVRVSLRDAAGVEVARAVVRNQVGPKPGSPAARVELN